MTDVYFVDFYINQLSHNGCSYHELENFLNYLNVKSPKNDRTFFDLMSTESKKVLAYYLFGYDTLLQEFKLQAKRLFMFCPDYTFLSDEDKLKKLKLISD